MNVIKKLLWIGIGLLVIFLFGGESIAGGFGWNYPEWLNVLSSVVEVVFGLWLLVSAIPLLRRRKGK